MTINSKSLNELLIISGLYSNRPDQVQGPGGNVSVKVDENIMLIKASGYRFEELNVESGVSAVQYSAIAEHFHRINPSDKAMEEKTMLDLVSAQVLRDESGKLFPKPSMETGFHAVLGSYVLHTHSVWSNLVNCAENSSELISSLNLPFAVAEIPFVSPGFGLSYLITDKIKTFLKKGLPVPEVFFLANHGIITHGATIDKPALLLEQADKAVKENLGLDADYPPCNIKEIDSGMWKPDFDFVPSMIKKYNCTPEFFDQVLFPDQTVFFKNNISNSGMVPGKISISSGGITYNCNQREASSIHETMTAYLYLHDTLNRLGLKARHIGMSEIDYINSMEMEKFRKGKMIIE